MIDEKCGLENLNCFSTISTTFSFFRIYSTIITSRQAVTVFWNIVNC